MGYTPDDATAILSLSIPQCLHRRQFIFADFPKARFARPVAGGEQSAVRGDGEAVNPIGGSPALVEHGIAVGINLPHDAFLAGGEEAASIRREGQREDGAFVTAHDAHHAPDGGLPDAHGAIVATGGALRSVRSVERTKGEALDGIGVLAEGAQEFAIGG